jgi:TolB-like protein
MSDATKAVFVSYAREDGAAAKRLCEALREAGLEVWFDANELRGGDAWDASIKRQIRECALFLPVISAQTQEREEGYFRREWKLAVERTHDLAETAPFLVPVAIDETPQAGALVPEAFMRAHWTRIPRGLPTPQFVEEVKRQLARARRRGSAPPQFAPSSVEAPVRPQSRTLPVVFALAVLVVAAAGGWWFTREPATADSAADTSLSQRAPTVPAKSIAVIPFANNSDDKDTNAFFADGIHEDILTNLSNIREMRVVSRTSVMEYRGTTKKMRQIAGELGVTYILEGSVQRSGNTVRVTGKLIDARADRQIWAKNYTRDLTDVFAIQTALAQEIASSLQTVLSPQEKDLLERRPTENIDAYILLLRAREVHNRPAPTLASVEEEERLLQKAVELDPRFAVAWAELASVRFFAYFGFDSPVVAAGKTAVDEAARLAPGTPEVLRSLGDYYYHGFRDYPHALEQYGKLLQLRPNDASVFQSIAAARRRQGHWTEARKNYEQAFRLDPGNLRNARDYAITLTAFRRFDEAISHQTRIVERLSDDLFAGYELALLPFLARGSTGEMEAFFTRLTAVQANSDVGIGLRKMWALRHGDLVEAVRLDELRPYCASSRFGPEVIQAIQMAAAFAAQGDLAHARERLGEFPTQFRGLVASDPANFALRPLAMMEALLGNSAAAVSCARRGVEILPESVDALPGAAGRAVLAFALAWSGDQDGALVEYAHLLQTPFGSANGNGGSFPDETVSVMRHDPRFAPLQGDPRFEALLNDPKNNAPLL